MIVAEIGINHGGDIQKAIEMIKVAAECGVDAVKFQVFKAEEIAEPGIPFVYRTHKHGIDCGAVTEDMYDMFKRHELGDKWGLLKNSCEAHGVEFIATAMGEWSLQVILSVGVKRIKIASSDLTNIPLIKLVNKAGLPVILSSGMAEKNELWAALNAIHKCDITIAACTSEYPTAADSAHISRVQHINEAYGKAGLSDHTIGDTAAIMAVAYGATYFEKHFTLDNNSHGPDHSFSANPRQLKSWVKAIKEAQAMKGIGTIKPTKQEEINKKAWQKNASNGYVRKPI
jgi:sialic acid synthase SpsE